MNTEDFFRAVRGAETIEQVETALDEYESTNGPDLEWIPVGKKENNKGPIEIATDPGRCIIERVTNGIDAVLEGEHESHSGNPRCQSPKEGARAWLGVPEEGLSALTTAQRRALAQRVTVTVMPGEDTRESRTVEVADRGVGLSPAQMPGTILSLNESNKMQKHYLAGVYGQGGSSTFAVSKYVLIASRHGSDPVVGFSIVRYNDLPPEDYKVGNYVYLTKAGNVLEANVPVDEFPAGTAVRHFGYDLTKYPSPLGPTSLYGLLNGVLFDPIVPVFLDNQVLTSGQRRTIIGSRNRLNGAADDDDDSRRGVSIVHNVPLYYSKLGEFGNLGIEYWVLDRPTKENSKPSASYVNSARPIILTHNGQNHAEITQLIIKKDCELPFLANRLICHLNCDSLTPAAKRSLLASTREDARSGVVSELIRQELIRVLKSDDELKRLNNEAREMGRQEQDKTVEQQMRNEVAKILRIHGLDIAESLGIEVAGGNASEARTAQARNRHVRPREIELHEPPTYIRILWDEDEEITFYPEQRRYIRIETDANSNYHDPVNASNSRVNIISTDRNVLLCGSTPLKGGRLRGIFECRTDAKEGGKGTIRVELSRPGMPVLSDERVFHVVPKPPARESQKKMTLPPFRVTPVDGIDSELWTNLSWPDNPNTVASSAVMNEGVLEVYYSTVFPLYRSRLARLEARDPSLGRSFTRRYEIWLAVHSLLLYQDQQEEKAAGASGPEIDGNSDEAEREALEQKERCRIATISAIFAHREVQLSPAPVEVED